MKRAAWVILAAVLFGVLLGSAAGASGPGESDDTKPIAWHVGSVDGAHTFSARTGWLSVCRRPRVVPHVVERKRSAVITLILHDHHPAGGMCLKMRGRVNVRIRLRRPLRDLVLYDGSTSPPRHRPLPWERSVQRAVRMGAR